MPTGLQMKLRKGSKIWLILLDASSTSLMWGNYYLSWSHGWPLSYDRLFFSNHTLTRKGALVPLMALTPIIYRHKLLPQRVSQIATTHFPLPGSWMLDRRWRSSLLLFQTPKHKRLTWQWACSLLPTHLSLRSIRLWRALSNRSWVIDGVRVEVFDLLTNNYSTKVKNDWNNVAAECDQNLTTWVRLVIIQFTFLTDFLVIDLITPHWDTEKHDCLRDSCCFRCIPRFKCSCFLARSRNTGPPWCWRWIKFKLRPVWHILKPWSISTSFARWSCCMTGHFRCTSSSMITFTIDVIETNYRSLLPSMNWGPPSPMLRIIKLTFSRKQVLTECLPV